MSSSFVVVVGFGVVGINIIVVGSDGGDVGPSLCTRRWGVDPSPVFRVAEARDWLKDDKTFSKDGREQTRFKFRDRSSEVHH